MIKVSTLGRPPVMVADYSGEYQPVYDEFGAVLVLVMTFMYRYDLTYHDIGISAESFVARLVTKGHESILPDEMSDEQGKHLGHWLKGLYDSGNEGLSNDVFASCSPREFYTIVPTLFQQTVMALSAGILSFESVKGGLECEQPLSVSCLNLLMLSRSHGDFLTSIADWWSTVDVISCTHADTQRLGCHDANLSRSDLIGPVFW
jgi:hypothetical protein